MTESNHDYLDHNDSAVLKHIDMYQGIINRMAANSAACKRWSITLVSAILAFVVKENQTQLAILAVLPLMIFWFLDAYYLGLENKFRSFFNASIKKIHQQQFTREDLFVVKADGKIPDGFLKGFTSWATWPVYLGQWLLIAAAYWLVG